MNHNHIPYNTGIHLATNHTVLALIEECSPGIHHAKTVLLVLWTA